MHEQEKPFTELPAYIRRDEHERIVRRRKLAGQEAGNPAEDATGLGLSGGGIRSSTFNLGLLQALQRYGVLQHTDYLSTVSGGGYIGACYTWFCSKLDHAGGDEKKPFPFGVKRADHNGLGGKVLYWLRAHGNYLTPDAGMNNWTLASAFLMGSVTSLLVLIPLLLTLVYLLAYEFDTVSGFGLLFAGGKLLLGILLVYTVFFAISTRIQFLRNVVMQRWMRRIVGQALMFSILLMVVGSIPQAYDFLSTTLKELLKAAMSVISLTGVIPLLIGLYKAKRGKSSGFGSFLPIALSLLIYGMFLWFYHLMHGIESFPSWLLVLLFVSVALALFANINHVSMHRYYRNRLMEAFMPHKLGNVSVEETDQCYLHSIPQTTAPYHLINTTVQMVGSDNPKWRERGGDNFIFSPLYSGSEATGYVRTEEYDEGRMNLATAFAISGAAVNSNSYVARSKALTFVMSLLNIRLGYWIQNPAYMPGWREKFMHPWWYWYLFMEMFGSGLNEKRKHVNLSDGGHFENLGLYELVRRRCRHIIISDAAADPHWEFEDFTRTLELLRVDFGVAVHINLEPLRPHGENKFSPKPWVRGTVIYNDGSRGVLIYIKTALFAGLPEDIYGYQRMHPNFPDESTADQFFDEAQFEAYRELGYQTGKHLCGGRAFTSFENLGKTGEGTSSLVKG